MRLGGSVEGDEKLGDSLHNALDDLDAQFARGETRIVAAPVTSLPLTTPADRGPGRLGRRYGHGGRRVCRPQAQPNEVGHHGEHRRRFEVARVTGHQGRIEVNLGEHVGGEVPVRRPANMQPVERLACQPIEDEPHGCVVAAMAIEKDDPAETLAAQARSDISENVGVCTCPQADRAAKENVVLGKAERKGRRHHNGYLHGRPRRGPLRQRCDDRGVDSHRKVMTVLLGRTKWHKDGGLGRQGTQLISCQRVEAPLGRTVALSHPHTAALWSGRDDGPADGTPLESRLLELGSV